MSEIWAIILAAGESKRMGSPKMLLPFNGKTLIGNVIGNISKSKIKNVLLVLGSDRDKIMKAVEGMPVKHCFNKNYKSGMLTSVQCGFSSLPDNWGAALVFLGDQPMVNPEVINAVVDAYLNKGKGIVMPVTRGRRGHPLLIDRKYRDEVMNLDPGDGLRALPQRFMPDVLEVEVGDQNILYDIDTEEEYLKALRQIK